MSARPGNGAGRKAPASFKMPVPTASDPVPDYAHFWLMEARVHATDAPAGGEDSAAALREGEKSDAFGFGLPERKRKRGAH